MDDDGSWDTLANIWVFLALDISIPEMPTLGTLGPLSTRPDSDECFSFIGARIKNCFASHSKCRTSISTPLPKRVLNIGSKSKYFVKLVEPGNIHEPFIALSHCWGVYQPIMTTSSTLAQMRTGITWNSLSNVFQDAITVARRLDIEWIWIDSLCIIQDSKLDWEIESAKMCDYYSGAYLTISASSSGNGTVPFLTERDSEWRTRSFPFICDDGRRVQVQARKHTGSSMAQNIEDLSPLASRGWCWQENVLSTRVLHYTQSELIFECKTEVTSEDGAKPRGFYSIGLTQKLSVSDENPYACWHNLIQSYSVRELTFETDKLPAVSGVAKILEDRTSSTYLAGLWEKNLPMDLCWSRDYVSTDAPPGMPPEAYIAPSWSWASVNGALEFVSPDPKALFTPLITVLESWVSVPGLNRFGEVRDGYIILKGLVSKVRVNCRDPGNCWAYTVGEDPMTREPMAPDCSLVPCEITSSVEGERAVTTLRRAQKEEVLEPFEIGLYALHIGHQTVDEVSSLYCLVIAPSNTGDGSYVRVGHFQIDDETWFEEALEMTVKIR